MGIIDGLGLAVDQSAGRAWDPDTETYWYGDAPSLDGILPIVRGVRPFVAPGATGEKRGGRCVENVNEIVLSGGYTPVGYLPESN